jgi:2-oxoglutarate dehydrogenase E2 component (dihydrolipoamide succinyltransferase)
MPVEIRVPALGESIVEATIARWLKAPGDSVNVGDPIVELETDKVNVEVPAEASGTLGQFSHQEGDTVGVGEVIGFVSENGGSAAPSAAAPTAAAPVEAPVAAPAATPAAPESNGRDTPVTPTASAMASANNVNLSSVQGTLPGGRIGKDDVVRASQPGAPTAPATVPAATAPAQKPATTPAAAPPSVSGRPEERIKMSRRRQTIATRLVEAQQTAAMLTTFNEIDMTAVMEVRKRRKESFEKRFGIGLGFTSFFTKAAIGALKAFPTSTARSRAMRSSSRNTTTSESRSARTRVWSFP